LVYIPTVIGLAANANDDTLARVSALDAAIQRYVRDNQKTLPNSPLGSSRWPDISFCLPARYPTFTEQLQRKTPCPPGGSGGGTWYFSQRIHDTEDSDNADSKSSNAPGADLDSRIGTSWCCYIPPAQISATSNFPDGNYCLLQQSPTISCPVGFTSGYRYHDDEDGNNENDKTGTIFGNIGMSSNTQYNFCCRQSSNTAAMYLYPTLLKRVPFYLFKRGSTCNPVVGYQTPSNEYLFLDDEDSNNKNKYGGWLPAGSYDRNTRYEYCYYVPLPGNFTLSL